MNMVDNEMLKRLEKVARGRQEINYPTVDVSTSDLLTLIAEIRRLQAAATEEPYEPFAGVYDSTIPDADDEDTVRKPTQGEEALK